MNEDCLNPGPTKDPNIDKPPLNDCSRNPTDPPSQKSVSGQFGALFEEPTQKKTGLGVSANCDPIQTGSIVNDLNEQHTRTKGVDYIYRYAKAIRGADEAMVDLFRNVTVSDDNSRVFPVPIIYGTQQRAIAFIMQDNTREKDLVVEKLRLPLLAIHNSGIEFNQERFIYQQALDYGRGEDNKPTFVTQEGRHPKDTIFGFTRGLPLTISYSLYAWTLNIEDMNQIVEQYLLKFSPVAYIRVRGVPWEIIVKNDGATSAIEFEPGDEARRVVKFNFNMSVETFLPQPIVRKKAVLKTKIDIVQSNKDKISGILSKIEEKVKGFE